MTHDEMKRAHDLAMDFVEALDVSENNELRWELFAIMCGISNLILPIEGDVRVLRPRVRPGSLPGDGRHDRAASVAGDAGAAGGVADGGVREPGAGRRVPGLHQRGGRLMPDEPPPGIDFSHSGELMPGIPTTCPHCHHEFEHCVSLEEYTDLHGPDGYETWNETMDDHRDVEITVTWSTSYSVIDLEEL